VSGHIVQHIALRAATGITALCTVLIIATMHTLNSTLTYCSEAHLDRLWKIETSSKQLVKL